MESKSSTSSASYDVIKSLQQTESEFGLSLLASTLAHEIRNPLQAIRLQLDAAMRGGPVMKSLQNISESMYRLESVVEKVQSLGQRYVIQRERVNLLEVVSEVMTSIDFWLKAAGIQVRTLSQWEGEPIVEADPELLQQVLLNLMMNSIQAMPDGGLLQVIISETTEHACLEVVDTGTGIPAEVLKVVGTPFFTTKQTGNGLGIAFCKTIASLHGGSIQIESSEGYGTHVTLEILKHDSSTTEETGNA